MTKIYVGNLPFSATESEVRDLFAQHGTVDSVALPTDRETGRPRGFGFVEMPQADAQKAMQALNGFNMGGRPLRVNEAQDRPRTGGGGRPGGGGGGRAGPGCCGRAPRGRAERIAWPAPLPPRGGGAGGEGHERRGHGATPSPAPLSRRGRGAESRAAGNGIRGRSARARPRCDLEAHRAERAVPDVDRVQGLAGRALRPPLRTPGRPDEAADKIARPPRQGGR